MDSLQSLDPFAQLNPNRLTPLQPQEENTLLGKIAGAGLGGLGYVGSVLEKTFGGRAIRGALGGQPRELLSVLPGSDLLGITDEADRVSGKQLLGLKDDDSWGSTLGGMGLEMALDPAMYLTFGGGALSRAGQVAKKVGALPGTATGRVSQTLADVLPAAVQVGPPHPLLSAAEHAAGGAQSLAGMMSEPLGGLAGVGLPFAQPAALLGTGQAGAGVLRAMGGAAQIADSTLRSVPLLGGLYGHGADFVGDTVPRYARALFSPEVMGATSHMGQEAAREAHSAIRPLVAEHLNKAARYGEDLRQAGVDPSGEVLRAVIEGTHQGPVHPAIQNAAAMIRQDLDSTLQRLQGLGVDVGQLSDMGLGYTPRYQTPLTKPTSGYAPNRQPLLPTDPRVSSREDILKGFTRGTGGVNDLVMDPAVYQGTPLQAAAHIRANYLHPTMPPQEAIPQSARLAEWVRGLDPQYSAAAQGGQRLNFFGNHPLADYSDYYQRIARLMGAGEATQSLLARAAEPALAGAQLPQGARSLIHALEDLRLTGQGGQSTLQGLLQGAGKQGALGDYYVPQNVLQEATRYLRGFTQPDAVNDVLGWADKLTTLTKAGQTAPWPAFHVRNLISGLWQNWIKGGGEALAETPNAYRLARGEVLPDANRIAGLAHLTPDQATQELAREMYSWGVGGHMPHLAREVAGPMGTPVNLGPDLQGFLNRIPGYDPKTVGGALQASVPRSLEELNPLNVAGVSTTQDLFAPVRGGRAMGDVVEGTNRGALYLSLRRQGYTPEQAAKEVLSAHFDYTRGAKTDLEAKVLSRLIPFYTFTRQNLPFQLEQLMTRPGGPGGVLARAAQDLRQEGGFLPDYLGSGLAIPTGQEDNGTQRYLTRLDLPPEQAFENLKGGSHGAQNSAMSLLSQLNPLLKGPLEFATGKQFFTGRDIGDLYTMTGSSTADQVLANSPLSRLATTARTLADERKWESPGALGAIPLNLLTGAKVTDVDMEKQRNIAAGEYLREQLRGQPDISSFTTMYPRVPLSQLSPEELMLLRLQKNVEKRAQESAKKKLRVE